MNPSEMIETLVKKDDDLEIIDVDHHTGDVLVETNVELIPSEYRPVPMTPDGGNSTLLRDELEGVSMDVHVKIIQTIFLANIIVTFMCVLLGLIPFQLSLLAPPVAVRYAMISIGSLFVLFYLVMLITHNRVVFLLWALTLCLGISLLTVLFNDFVLFQILAGIFLQSCMIVVYATLSPRHLNPLIGFLLQIASGVAAWLIGLYAFIEEQDWGVAGSIIGIFLGFALYSTLQIRAVERYSLRKDHMTSAIINFYGDPVAHPCRLLRQKCVSTPAE